MKVVCETCNTRYAISDEKVRGKAFKIKCKKCGAFMVVRAHGTHENAAESLDSHAHAVAASHAEALAAPEPTSAPAPEAAPGADDHAGLGAEAAAAKEEKEEKETRVFNYAEFERLMADKAETATP